MIHNYIGEKNLEKILENYTKDTLSLFASALCNFV